MPPTARDAAGELLRRVGFPHPPYAWVLVRLAFFVWLALRVVLAGGLYLTSGRAGAPPHWRAAVLFVVFPVLVVLLDRRVMREDVFCRDLGGDPAWIVVLALLGAGLPELAADTLLSLTCGCG